MKCSPAQLHERIDGTLSPAESAALDSHLATCPACRTELESLARLRAATAALPRELTPAQNLWPAISAQLQPPRAAAPQRFSISSFPLSSFQFLAVAASVAFLCTLLARYHAPAPTWSVAALAGAPRVAARLVKTETPFRVGQWLETDATSRAKVAVGSIGEVKVEPNSRLRLVGAAATDHRIQLARGTVDAVIWAPPRLFFVDTPSATAVDLGCAYTLTSDDQGNGELHVTAGFVALEHAGREAIVPYRFKCATRRDAGPGTPYYVEASPALRAAIETFDFGPRRDRDNAFAAILAQAGLNDRVTLWHLLSRTDGPQRAAAFEALARLTPPPANVTRAGILAGDATMRRTWGIELGLGPF